MDAYRHLSYTLIASFALLGSAQAKCTTRVGDELIQARYSCKSKGFISYLHNNLVTPYSFDCAKKLTSTCQEENCANPQSDESKLRCLGLYADVLDGCKKQIDDAAIMARCTDTKAWPIAAVAGIAKAPEPNPAPRNLVMSETLDPRVKSPKPDSPSEWTLAGTGEVFGPASPKFEPPVRIDAVPEETTPTASVKPLRTSQTKSKPDKRPSFSK